MKHLQVLPHQIMHLSILTAGGGTGSQGDLSKISGKITGTGGTVTITDNTILGIVCKS